MARALVLSLDGEEFPVQMQKIDRDDFVRWFHVERIARAAGLPTGDERWREIQALWRTASDRKKMAAPARRWTGRLA